MDKARVESFSDGVFAFAIRLLVFGFQVPDLRTADGRALVRALVAQVPQLIPHVTSFATIGIIWLHHHAMFPCGARRPCPQSAASIGRFVYILSDGGARPLWTLAVQCSAVGGDTHVLGGACTLLWRHIVKRKLSRVREEAGALRTKTRRNLIPTLGYSLGTATAFGSPKTSVAIYLALAMFYFFPAYKTRI
jgi:hypothetical protein